MKHEKSLRTRTIESIPKLKGTRFDRMIPEFEAVVRFTDTLSRSDPQIADFGLRRLEAVDHQIRGYLELYDIIKDGPPLFGKSPEDTERMLKVELLEKLVSQEALEYAEKHGWGKVFKPHSRLESAVNADMIIRSGDIDIGLSVEPEGCAYAYFFETLGLGVLHVYAEFDGMGGIDFQLAEPLDAMRGRRVLIIEDDIRSGLTMRNVLEGIRGIDVGSYSLFLGNNLAYQNLDSVPPQIVRTYLNTMERTGLDRDALEARFVELLGTGLFSKHAVFRQ